MEIRTGFFLPASTLGRAPRMICSARCAASRTRRNLLSTVGGCFSSIFEHSPLAANVQCRRVDVVFRLGGGSPILEVFEDLLNPVEHSLPPVTLLQDDGGQGLACPRGVIIDDNIPVPLITLDLRERYGQAPGDALGGVEAAALEPLLEGGEAGRHDEDAVRLR